MPTTSAQKRSYGPGYTFCSVHGVLISLQTLPLCRSYRIQFELCLLPRFLLSCPSRLAAWGSCCPHRCSRRSDRAPPFDGSWKKTNEATSFSSSENPSWVCFLFGGLFLAHGSPTRPPLQWSPEFKKQTWQFSSSNKILIGHFQTEQINGLPWGGIFWYPYTRLNHPPPFCPNTCASQMRGDLTPAPQSPSHLLGSLHLNTKFKGLLSLLQTMKARWIPGSKTPPPSAPPLLPQPHALAQLVVPLSSHILRC